MKMIRVIADHRFRKRDAADRFFELARTVADAADSEVHCSDAGSFDIREHGWRRAGIGRRVRVESARAAERVDHDRLGVRLFGEAALRCCSPGDGGGGQCGNHRRRQKFASIEHVVLLCSRAANRRAL